MWSKGCQAISVGTQHLYFKGMRLYIPADKFARIGEMESMAWKEKKLMTELRPIYICSACASLILPLAVCFVNRESQPYSCQS